MSTQIMQCEKCGDANFIVSVQEDNQTALPNISYIIKCATCGKDALYAHQVFDHYSDRVYRVKEGE